MNLKSHALKLGKLQTQTMLTGPTERHCVPQIITILLFY